MSTIFPFVDIALRGIINRLGSGQQRMSNEGDAKRKKEEQQKTAADRVDTREKGPAAQGMPQLGVYLRPVLKVDDTPQKIPSDIPDLTGFERAHALYDFTGLTTDELTFKAGDALQVKPCPTESWWLAWHIETWVRGYVPRDYVTTTNDLHNQIDGWYDITRNDAARMLLMPGLSVGTFVIRPCSGMLCILVYIRHYNI